MDRDLYKTNMQQLLLNTDGTSSQIGIENLDILEASADDLLLDEGEGIETFAPLADPGDSDMNGGDTNNSERVRLEKAKALSSAPSMVQ